MNIEKLVLTQSRLHEIFHYDPETGDFIWIASGKKRRIFENAGGKSVAGYIVISLSRKRHFAHRLIWLWMTGAWPKKHIDHINGIKDDNRWCNLREANKSQNAINSKIRSTNTIGYKGVTLDKRTGRYGARARLNGEYFHFGWFDDPYEAHLAYVKGTKVLHGEFVRSE